MVTGVRFNQKRYGIFLAGLLIAGLLALAGPVAAVVIPIDNSTPTALADAIAAASSGDSIVLSPGTYFVTGSGFIIDKDITIRSNTSTGSETDTMIDGRATGTGIFHVSVGGSLHIVSLTLQNGYATSSGGAIDNRGTVSISGSRITGCWADTQGGAINNLNGIVMIISSTIDSCQAGVQGGAIASTGTSTVSVLSSTFASCSAARGGAIYSGGSGSVVTVYPSLFVSCWATNDGGTIYMDMGTLTISGATFTTSTAADYGGALYAANGCLATIDQATFTRCGAYRGGAIENLGTMTVTGGTFDTCQASGTGGSGGAIDNAGTADIVASLFSGCSASAYGGAIQNLGSGTSTVTITSSTFTGCSAVTSGGAILNNDTVSIRTSEVSGCSSGHGGAIFNAGTAGILSSAFSGCRAASGGVIFNFNGATITSIRFSRFTNNSATGAGKVIYNPFLATIADATDTWWGTNGDPSGGFSGVDTYDPWLQLGGTASPSAITAAGSSVIRANLTFDTTPSDTSASGHIPNSTRVDFAVVSGPGSLSAASNATTLGAAETTMTPTGTGTVNISATVDSQTVYIEVPVTDAPVPTVTGITPDTGINTSSVTITDLAGSDFWMHGTTVVSLNRAGESITATGVTVVSPAQITCTLPITSAEAGTWDVLVINPDGREGGLPGGFTITAPAPVISGITPGTGTNSSAVSITDLHGSWFQAGAVVNLTRTGHDNITATGVSVVSGIWITCSLPITGAEAGSWDVVVTNPDGQEAMLAGGFTIIPPAPTTVPTTVPVTGVPGPLSTLDTRDNGDFPSSGATPAPTGAGTFPLMTVTVNIGGNSAAGKTTVTGTKLADFIVTGTAQPGPGNNQSAPPGTVFQYLRLDPARYGSITGAFINFSVPRSWLDENHIAPGSIVLYHQTAVGGWEALPTMFLYEKDGTAFFFANSPGFSLFAIAGTPAADIPPVTIPTESNLIGFVQEKTTPQAAITQKPIVTGTTAAPAPAEAPAGSSSFPVLPALIGIGCVGLVGGSWYARRWWIRRQNPALFEEF